MVSASVRKLGCFAFCQCKLLRKVVFEPGSRLEFIRRSCFAESGLRKVIIPASVRVIDSFAFYSCQELSALSFEEGSRLSKVDFQAFHGTRLRPENVHYPDTLKPEEHWHEW